ncbi:MAG: DNA-3-methyladenine glycosylase 2 family protein [Gemmataceae bacterium]|nr:DNA-3-methyladenine glycosylase 2 family protein [Gemmataceae bacterium]
MRLRGLTFTVEAKKRTQTWPLRSKKVAAYLSDQDPKLKAVIDSLGPCRIKSDPDLFQVICRTIIYQLISTKAANTIIGRVEKVLPNQRFEPEGVLKLGIKGLRKQGISRAKSGYLLGLAQGAKSGELCPGDFFDLSDEEVCQKLCQFSGVGPWSAQMVLMFSLGRPDVLPYLDFGLRSSVRGLYGLREMPNKKKLEEITQCWKPYRSAGVWYMWRRLESVPG